MAQFRERVSGLAVPASGYAPTYVTLAAPAGTVTPELEALTVVMETAPAGAIAEVWLPRVNASRPPLDSEYFYSGQGCTFTSGGASATIPLAKIRGAQIRVKSGGTAGSADISVVAD